VDHLVATAERIGSDGRGRSGLFGFVKVLARDRPTVFTTLFYKVHMPRKRSTKALLGGYHAVLQEATLKAAEQIGRNGRGRNGLRGYFLSLGARYPKSFVKMLHLLLDIETEEQRTAADQASARATVSSWSNEQLKSMSLEEKMALMKSLLNGDARSA